MYVKQKTDGTFTLDTSGITPQRQRKTFATLTDLGRYFLALENAPHQPSAASPILRDIVQQWRSHSEAQSRHMASYKTRLDYALKALKPLLSGKVGDFSKAMFDRYAQKRRKAGVTTSTIHKEFNVLHAALEHAVSRDVISVNPLHGYWRNVRERPRKYPIPTQEEIQRIFDAVSGDDAKKAFYFLLATGCRFNDMAELVATDISSGTIHFKNSKFGTERCAPLPALPFDLPAEGRVFTNKGKKWDKDQILLKIQASCRKCKLPLIRTHDLRHAYATYSLALGLKDQYDLMAECGWKSMQMVQRYTEISTRFTKAAKFLPDAFGKVSPRCNKNRQQKPLVYIPDWCK